MLVVHPSSLCDVCLDPYGISSEPANAPHAIACGHIFCLTCLRSLAPSACPLCRKAFQPDRVKKLHVAGPPEVDDSSEEIYNARLQDLLQRVALVSGENEPEENVVQVVTEVENWLATQSDDPDFARPLRAAVAALQRYKALLDSNARDKIEFRRLRTQFRSSRRTAEHDSKTSRAVEESLLTRIQEIENENTFDLRLQISRLQTELDSLRSAQPRYRNTSNPLPPPPEPLPLDRFGIVNGRDTTFASMGNASETSRTYPLGQDSRRKPTTNGTTTTSKEQSASHVGYAPPSSRHHRPPESLRAQERSERVSEPEDTRSLRSYPAMDPIEPRPAEADRIPASRMHIVPGATREQRFVPPIAPSSPNWTIHADRGVPPHAEQESESRRRVREWERVTNGNSQPNNTVRPGVDRQINADTRLASAAAYVNGYGSGYESGYHLARNSEVRPSSYERSHSFPVQESPEQIVGGLGLTGVPYPPPNGTVSIREDPSDSETPRNRAHPLQRRHTVNAAQLDRTVRAADVPLQEAGPDRATRRPAPSISQSVSLDNPGPRMTNGNGNGNAAQHTDGAAARRSRYIAAVLAPLMGENDSPRSETTWGTVQSVSRSSMSELGLVGFQNGAGVRGEGSIAGDSVVGRDQVLDESEEDDESGVDDGSGTPMMPGSFAAGRGDGSVLGLILEDDGDYPRGNGGRRPRQRSISYTEMPTPSADDQINQRQRNLNGRQRDHRRHVSQPSSVDGPQPHTQLSSNDGGFGNALSLSFDASLPTHAYPAFPAPPPYSGSGFGREIIAPTPIVGGPNVAHLWANRT
ncbi:hypothetical protein BJ138DRAFT_1141534 [Hygrophoropsis aurantiaca]|uniref:Uncharacterized protein n=1 Tax=Hygrophoropsis aurantiaca TaxID=72124 RepID=A0ACB8APQ5_9AGAM|nr:hypothetical protein BJ138DRAFT_1141534 [Hygrophoropsis aurantiaca]